jgi:hypothetical protein
MRVRGVVQQSCMCGRCSVPDAPPSTEVPLIRPPGIQKSIILLWFDYRLFTKIILGINVLPHSVQSAKQDGKVVVT